MCHPNAIVSAKMKNVIGFDEERSKVFSPLYYIISNESTYWIRIAHLKGWEPQTRRIEKHDYSDYYHEFLVRITKKLILDLK